MKLEARLVTSTARSIAFSSSTARRSSIHSSMDGNSDAGTGSDRPVPRLSNVSTRPNRASRPMNSASGGTSHWLSTLLNHWVSSTTSTGPSPTSWYATYRPLFLAYRVSGSVTVTRSQPKLGTHLVPDGADIHRRPVLDQPAVADPEDVDELELDPISCRRQVPEFAKVRPPECLAGRNEVALGELLVDLHGCIRKPLQQRAVERPEAARGAIRLRERPPFRPVVVHELRVKCLVGVVQIVLILAPLRTQPPRACCRRPTSPPLPRTATIMHHRLSPPPGLQGQVAFEQVAEGARGTRVCQAGAVSPGEPGTAVALPDPALVVLVGASGSGKSAWAAEHYRPDEVVSSDRLRALVGSGE